MCYIYSMRNMNGYFALRFSILARDNFTCRYCGRSAPSVPLEVDHLVPVASGGNDEADNLVTSCWSCNRGKGDLLRSAIIPPKPRARKKKENPESKMESLLASCLSTEGPQTATELALKIAVQRSRISTMLANSPRFTRLNKVGRNVYYDVVHWGLS